jgi:hypothetical protein
MNRSEVVAEFYEILQGRRAKRGVFKLLATCHGKMGWPARSAYFFFEVRELREDGIRPHLALDKEAPSCRRSRTVGAIATIPILGGRHHHMSGFRF